VGLSPETLLRYNRPGPRYTSYPTAPVWAEAHSDEALHSGLAGLRLPATLYVHIPFCAEQCTFCGCNMVVAGRREPGTRYLNALERQIEALPLPADRVAVQRIHLGGGTPTWLQPDELERLYAILFRRFVPVAGAELSVEADPEVTTDAQVDTLARLGVNRLSMGVQSFDPKVLAAVNRPQRQSRVAAILEQARGLGMYSLNLDLIYGLPHQHAESFAETLDLTLAMRPDRLAIFGYAHVPWLKPHMKQLDASALPGPVERARLFLLAHERLTAAGYQAIGLDHFALPEDELAVAQREERLHRNFMGYTTRPGLDLVGLGMSAISEFQASFVQQKVKLAPWWRAVEEGQPVTEKALVLSAEDQLRREVISRIMCNFVLPYAAIEAAHGVSFEAHFAEALADLAPLEADGLVERRADRLVVTEKGRLLVRNVAMCFDAYLAAPSTGPRFSQTV